MDGHVDELKELVKVSLQQSGALGSIKAQLRAAVFKVVNQEAGSAAPLPSSVLSTSEGALAADLVREFLEWHKLQSSLAVLVPEAQLDGDTFPGRSALAERLDLANSSSHPLLVELLEAHLKRGVAPAGGSENSRPGAGKSLLGDLPGLPDAKSQAGEGGASARPQQQEDEDEELTSTTRRIRPEAVAIASSSDKSSPPSKSAAGSKGYSSSSSPGSATDVSMEARKQEMMAGALSAEKAMDKGTTQLDMSDDDFGADDIVEEDIDPADNASDLDEVASPFQGGGGGLGFSGLSVGESATEMSVSDRSVDGSMALDGFDHVESVGR